MSEFEFVLVVFMIALTLIAAGHMIGYHRGWQDGYWTEHPGSGEDSNEGSTG